MQPHVVLPTQPESVEVKISDLTQWSTAECPGSIRRQQEVEVAVRSSSDRKSQSREIAASKREQLCVRNRFESPWIHTRSGSKVYPTRIESSPAYLFQTKWRVE
jgi:hypothetical protein